MWWLRIVIVAPGYMFPNSWFNIADHYMPLPMMFYLPRFHQHSSAYYIYPKASWIILLQTFTLKKNTFQWDSPLTWQQKTVKNKFLRFPTQDATLIRAFSSLVRFQHAAFISCQGWPKDTVKFHRADCLVHHQALAKATKDIGILDPGGHRSPSHHVHATLLDYMMHSHPFRTQRYILEAIFKFLSRSCFWPGSVLQRARFPTQEHLPQHHEKLQNVWMQQGYS